MRAHLPERHFFGNALKKNDSMIDEGASATEVPALVTIILPVFDVEDYLTLAVRSAHAQDWPMIELIAIDDGSRDRSAAILANLKKEWTGKGRVMRVIRQKNQGASAARNVGLEAANGDFVCFLDADDMIGPTLVSSMVAALEADSSLRLAAPGARYIDETGSPIGVLSSPRKPRYTAQELIVHGPIQTATGVMTRAEFADQTGLFDLSLSGCIDLDWFVRLVAGHGAAAAALPDVVIEYRKRSGQITADWRRMRDNWRKVLGKMAAAGFELSDAQHRRAEARNRIFWATIAYQTGDYSAARSLVASAWQKDPWRTLRDPLGRMRTLAVLASFLPEKQHAALARIFDHVMRSRQ